MQYNDALIQIDLSHTNKFYQYVVVAFFIKFHNTLVLFVPRQPMIKIL